MARTTKGSPPRYRQHKPTDQAVVTIDGRDFYLAKHGTLASCCEYDRLIAEWLSMSWLRVQAEFLGLFFRETPGPSDHALVLLRKGAHEWAAACLIAW